MPRVGLIAGEASGDLLGAELMEALRAHWPQVQFEGIAGPRMAAAGCRVLADAEELAVMGLVEVLGHYRRLRALRNRVARHFLDDPPDVFIGIDAPDFNLGLEERLHAAGIKTVHYVSPSVWAWRRYRTRQIARAVDLMLTLFPFEAGFYREHDVPVRFVGHPLADRIPFETDRAAARRQLQLPADGPLVALLPGSRMSEVTLLGKPYLETAGWCLSRHPGIHFVLPVASPRIRDYFDGPLAAQLRDLPVTLIDGQSRLVIEAADVVLCASGTATLETLLLQRPMIVAYAFSPVTYWLAKRLVRLSHYSLPNLLAGRPIVDEYIQSNATASQMGPALLRLVEDREVAGRLRDQFAQIHRSLRCDASVRAAEAVVQLVERPAGEIAFTG